MNTSTKTTRRILRTLSMAAFLGLSGRADAQNPPTAPGRGPDTPYEVAVDQGVMIPTRDGTR